jgi:ribonucleoside-diphosphate reductase alpha chain
MYYLRSKAATDPIKFTLSKKHQQKFVQNAKTNDPIVTASVGAEKAAAVASTAPVKMAALDITEVSGKICSIDNPDCEACSA